ncbi:hypothetical protein CXG81DRAFT_11390 [Caulochytrium protostelioides]|uniref:Multifunctional fusion protein n=1 Tax=Caulochytrium protostelioides TaxID=1555241 RepID=A0A4P9X9B1_9FUNG|nr:hypothetical protein CXG81DRAFT_11390 [Caulochytrium protostelioides]|eukprot:RKP01923.1 hypothetical protein CXG81DRAFT_11390 [Caulochytrium protostelioides]
MSANATTAPVLGHFRLPKITNEPMMAYAPGSKERLAVQRVLRDMTRELDQNGPFQVPLIINGERVTTARKTKQRMPFDHARVLCEYSVAEASHVVQAVEGAMQARATWEAMPFNDRAAIFLKAADLLAHKYRYKMMAATMLGQAKNVWQAEIDCAAELCDFWRFNCQYAADIYAQQPTENSPTTWNRTEYRGLEGFVLAYSPFNFTAIGGNLASAPALMGNVVLWKPSDAAVYSNLLIMEILHEAGLPKGVIQFLPGDAASMAEQAMGHRDFAGLHFTGSTQIFQQLWQKAAANLDVYRGFPRIVGETGGKNMHFVHESASMRHAAVQTVRAAFEYNGQKCSACSRVYVPDTRYNEFRDMLLQETARLHMGPPENSETFVTAVINEQAFNRIDGYLADIKSGKNASTTILAGGQTDASKGYFIEPTVLETTDPKSPTMVNELFGPVVTLYKYPAAQYEETLQLADATSNYALTAAVFADDRAAVIQASNALRHAAGNFYINDKCTGAVVGQQPFGGGRHSGTNDKAGAALNLLRWVSARSIKENFVPVTDVKYPSNLA